MAHEQTLAPWSRPSPIPEESAWPSLLKRDGDALETHDRRLLEALGKEKGMLGLILRKARNKVQHTAKLRRLVVDLIGPQQWMTLDVDVKDDACEGHLEKNAQDTKGGVGQHLTSRALIRAMVEFMHPQPGETIPRVAGAPAPTRSSSPATRSASRSSG